MGFDILYGTGEYRTDRKFAYAYFAMALKHWKDNPVR